MCLIIIRSLGTARMDGISIRRIQIENSNYKKNLRLRPYYFKKCPSSYIQLFDEKFTKLSNGDKIEISFSLIL